MRYTIVALVIITETLEYWNFVFNMEYLTAIFHTNSHAKFETYQDLCEHLTRYVPEIIQCELDPVEVLQDQTYEHQNSIQCETKDNSMNPMNPMNPTNHTNTNTNTNIARFSPRKEDSLFWSIYIAKHGVKEFMSIGRYHNIELEEKQKMVAAFQKAPAQLKQTNIKISNVAIQEILADLMINKRTQLSTIIAMSVYYGVEIYLVNESNCVYLRYTPSVVTETAIIYKDSTRGINYSVSTGSEHEILVSHIRDTMLELGHGAKLLPGISHYKVEDLEEIAGKINVNIGLDSGKKMKKTELYAKIVEKAVM